MPGARLLDPRGARVPRWLGFGGSPLLFGSSLLPTEISNPRNLSRNTENQDRYDPPETHPVLLQGLPALLVPAAGAGLAVVIPVEAPAAAQLRGVLLDAKARPLGRAGGDGSVDDGGHAVGGEHVGAPALQYEHNLALFG